jgi:hypothetical protein
VTELRRIQCIGYGRPCAHWWYQEGPGRPRKRCEACTARRRWLHVEHPTACSECGAPLPMNGGRPRTVCSSECARARRKTLKLLSRFA